MNKPYPLALLVQLPIPPPGPQPIEGNVPLAAAYLKLFAHRRGLKGWQIEILPARLCNRLGDQALVAAILDRGPQIVGFTCYLWNIQRTMWIAQQVKAARPGKSASCWAGRKSPPITAGCWRNRRSIWPRSARASRPSSISFPRSIPASRPRAFQGCGIAAATCRCRARRSASLDLISSPYIEGLLDAAEEQTMLMETSRGCRYRCKFCYYPKSYDSIYRLSAEKIEADLRHACQRGVREIYLLDPTLNQRPDFAGFLRLLAQGNPDRQFTYSAELRAEGIRAETARLLREANFQEVEVGLQSVDPEAQKLMGRHVSLEAFERGRGRCSTKGSASAST